MAVRNVDRQEVWVRTKHFAKAVYEEVVPYLPAEGKGNLKRSKQGEKEFPASHILCENGESYTLDETNEQNQNH